MLWTKVASALGGLIMNILPLNTIQVMLCRKDVAQLTRVFVGCRVEKVSVWWAVNLSVGGGSDMVEGGTAGTVRAEGQED